MLCKIHGTENQVVMYMAFVNMGSQHIFIFTAKDAVGKLPPDLMGCFGVTSPGSNACIR